MEVESSGTTTNQIKLLQTAIQQLLDSKSTHNHNHDHDNDNDNDNDDLLTKLLSQLESLKVDGFIKSYEPSNEANKVASCTQCEAETDKKEVLEPSSNNTDDVVKELKKLERQNRITHWLLSALIVLTAVWQLSEVSLLLKLKHGLTHPFGSLGSFVTGMFKRPIAELEEDKQSAGMQVGAENRLKFAKDLQSLILNDDQE